MNQGDYFFFVFLATIAATRLFLLTHAKGPTIKGFRVRHYMYGIVLMVVAYFINNLTVWAIGLAWLIDELPPVLVKGPGHRDEQWRGCEDYYSEWCVAGVMALMVAVYVFRDTIARMI